VPLQNYRLPDASSGHGSLPETDRKRKGNQIMTKARARERAKAKAGQKAKKRDVAASHPGEEIKRGQFDPGSGSIKTPGAKANTKSFAASGRGAARSR
jgi:hypothetical protein